MEQGKQETAIAKTKTIEPTNFDEMLKRADVLVKTGFLPDAIKTKEQAVAVVLTGKELGLGMMTALREINIVKGKPCMSTQLMLALCRNTKQLEYAYPVEETEQKAVFAIKRAGQPEYKSVITREDCDKAKFTQVWDKDRSEWKIKDNWVKQPKTMLMWRAISKACRVIFPDAVSGVYTAEEIADGVVVEEILGGETKVVEVIEAQPSEHEEKEIQLDDAQLPQFVMPFGKFQGMTLVQISEQKTEGGRAKGVEYLDFMRGQDSNAPEEVKKVLTRFLKAINFI